MKTRKLLTAVIAFLAFAVTTLAQTVPSYVPTNGLVGYWGFNGNANDLSGNGNNGTVNGATLTTDRNGNTNSAYSFDGISNFIRILNNNNLNVQSGQSLSISFWIKHDINNSNIDKYIVTRYNQGVFSNSTYGVGTGQTGNGYFYVQPQANINGNELRGNINLNDGNWHNIVVVWENGNKNSLFVDKVLDVYNIYNSLGNINNNNDLIFGCGVNLTQFYSGNIDDISIYNRALNQTEISQLYNSNPVQNLCTKTTQPYNVNVGDATHDGSTYSWSISPATPSAVMTGNGSNAITIDWTNAPSGTYTLQAIETSVEGCVSEAVSATINLSTTPTAPVASPTQTFCTASTVANLTATGTNLQWFAAATGGTALASSTALVSGTTYYVSQTTGTCESTRTALAVSITQPTAPTAVAQTFCTSATVANLVATGTAIKWYAALTGGTALASTTALVSGTTYYVSQTTGTCESTRTAVAVTITQKTTPTFTQVAAVCSGATISALPTTSTNAVTGSWSPAINNLATTTYTFTPTAGLCANTTTMTITVTPKTTPTFTQVAAVCSGATIAALPTTSINGITGTWSPAINNLATTTYTFTPTAGLCANTATMTITVNPNIEPTFTQVAPICAGTSLSSLPTTSDNGITGTWSPAINNLATTEYTFTPTAGLCANTVTMTITVNPSIEPTFTQVAPICAGAALSSLPTTSDNGIIGIWSPELNNLATTTYTFTPTIESCATTATMTITVNLVSEPSGASPQFYTQGSILESLVAIGQNIQWYSTPFGNTLLSNSTPLENGITYYASQTINGCESQDRLPVTVQFTLNNNEFDTINIVYNPNPVIDILYIKASSELKNAKICNVLGQTISQQRFNSNEIQLNMSDFSTGTYFVIVESDDRKETFKILKK